MARDAVEAAIFRRIGWRLLPVLTFGYILNVLDRGNIAIASLQMNQEIGLTPAQFGFGAGILYVGYCGFEIPSNVALYHFGVSRWLTRIIITWGVVEMGCAMISGPRSFYLMRVLLGVTEAGFFPGVAFLMSQWFPADYRARMLAVFLLAIPLTSLFGSLFSGALLDLDRLAGVSAWRWIFIIEGLPAVALGFVMPGVLADRPAAATWLTVEERIIVEDRIASESRYHEVGHFWAALKDKRVLMLALILLGFTSGSYGVGFWLPQMIKSEFDSNLTVGLVSAGAYLLAAIAMLVWASHVDRSGRDVGSLVFACGMATAGLLLSVAFDTFWICFLGLTLALVGINSARAIFWSIPPRFLTGIAAAGGLAFLNSVGAMGGFIGPAMMGWLKDTTGSFAAGLAAMSACLLLSTGLAIVMALAATRD